MRTCEVPSWVAIVDDETALRESIESLLRSAGFQATGFRSAEDFLGAPWHGAACLILDITLPGMNGLELQRHLSGQGALLPIVFLTALDDPGDLLRAQARRFGALAFLHKPFVCDELLSAVGCAVLRSAPAPCEKN
ncbi:response regulator [Aquabacterium sp. A7-Y]|uniref:response regulator transcription factor n=1 Tax=Aquabacterium sp. A7-Y TaxID=1349605 RepID=UPI00223CD3D7|nr:response regulator [Aquabacterium sp. A7-Y]MCW7540847.1 response regulator [Aquabacterium sp. A7-Y]